MISINMKELEEANYFYRGDCMYCGKEASEAFYSGSCESYLKCKCTARAKASKVRSAMHEIKESLEERLRDIKTLERIEEITHELRLLKGKVAP